MVTDRSGKTCRILGVGTERGAARFVADALGTATYDLHWVKTAARALEHAPEVWPELVVMDARLDDRPASELCRRLLAESRVPVTVPIVLCGAGPPEPEERLAALGAGARGFLGPWLSPEEVRRECGALLAAKQEMDRGLAESLVDAATGLYNRRGVVRRMREIGAQAIRQHEALACLVLELGGGSGAAGAADQEARPDGMVSVWLRGLLGATRMSDVTGRLGPTSVAVIAPGTPPEGAVRLAGRLEETLRRAAARDRSPAALDLRVGYDAVGNLAYAPTEPVAMLLRASTAVRSGRPEPAQGWIRRYSPDGEGASG